MATLTGSDILAKSLVSQGMDTLFYIMGGPMIETEAAIIKLGARAIDTRHEQAASLMAHAYSRITRKPGVCMGASGPGATNLVTGVANAFVDAAPMIAVGDRARASSTRWRRSRRSTSSRSSSRSRSGPRGSTMPSAFPSWSPRPTARRRPASPGPVYIDMPGDVLGESLDESTITYPKPWAPAPRSHGDPAAITEAVALLAKAERPLILGGSGVWWSDAAAAFQAFVEATGIPFYTTPISRGTVAEDHELAFLNARAKAFSEVDVLLAVGTRFNFVIQFGRPPRFAADAKVIHVDVNPTELNHNRPADVPIAGDARAVLEQLTREARSKIDKNRYARWISKLKVLDTEKASEWTSR